MEKKEFPKKENGIKESMPKAAGLGGKAFSVIKFVLGICLLPFVYSNTVAFLNEFNVIPKLLQNYFWAGIITFVIIYFFIYEPAVVYAKGQKFLEVIFSFFAPLVKVAPYVLPIYSIIIFLAYLLLSLIIKSGQLLNYFMFIFGLSLALHLVFGAKSLRSKQGDLLKANYIFGFSFVYILNIALAAFCFNVIFKEFSFVNFFNNSFQGGSLIFGAVFKQLFL